MSQQHMHDPDFSAESASYSRDYGGETPSQNYPSSFYGQKLTAGRIIDLNITAGQRLALAIVSLSFFMFLILLFVALAFTSLASDTAAFISAGVGILALYSIVATIINIAFNRRH